MSKAKMKSKQDYPQTEVEITAEMRELLASFTPEEIETGVIKTGRPPASGSHPIHDLVRTYEAELLEDTIGEMLRTVRERHHHSLSDAAQVLGVSRSRAHQLEHREANLRIDTLLRYAGAYGYRVQVAFVPKDKNEQSIIAELPEATTQHHNE